MTDSLTLYHNIDWKVGKLNHKERNIPIDWNISNIGKKLNEFKPSKLNASVGNKNGLYPFFNASEKQSFFCDSYLVDDESIIITTGGDYAFAQYFEGKFAYSSHVWCFKMKEDNNKFFSFLFKYFFEEIQNLSVKGFKLKNLNKKDFKKIDFYFPPTVEQEKIASILAAQESIILKTKEVIKQIEKRNQFISDELLSGRIRIKEENGTVVFYKNLLDNYQELIINDKEINIPKDWDYLQLKKNISIKTGRKDANVAKINGQYAFFTCGKQILKTNTYDFDCEAILIAGNGVVGETKYYSGKFDAYQRVYVLSSYKYDLKFLYIYMKKLFKDSLTVLGSAMPYIKIGDLENFYVCQPKNFNERSNLLKIITSFMHEKEKYELILQEEENKFTFLLEELMSGRLRVKI